MAFKYELIITPEAYDDFEDAYNYVRFVLRNEVAAKKLLKKSLEAINHARDFPTSNPIYKEWRKAIVGNYLIFYEIDEDGKTIIVHSVYNSKMDYQKYI